MVMNPGGAPPMRGGPDGFCACLCPHCRALLPKQTKFCPECGGRLMEEPKENRNLRPGDDLPIFINYFERHAATPGREDTYEITLCPVSDTEAQLDVFIRANASAPEVRRSYRAPRSLIDECMAAIRENRMESWAERKDCFGMTGMVYVVKFRKGDKLVRVSSERCPLDGKQAFFAVKGLLSAHIREENAK